VSLVLDRMEVRFVAACAAANLTIGTPTLDDLF